MVIPNHPNWDYNDYSPSPWIPAEVKAIPRPYINYKHLNELMRTIVPNFERKVECGIMAEETILKLIVNTSSTNTNHQKSPFNPLEMSSLKTSISI